MSARVTRAMHRVRRADFLPPGVRHHAPVDVPLTIGHGQTNSQPWTVAFMLGLLDVRPGHRVLDVGAGSGWSTALLHELLDARGSLAAVEIVPELVKFGQANLDAAGVDVKVSQARAGVLGLPEQAPFDRILVSAESADLPAELVAQLAPGGIMVIPVAGAMWRVEKRADGDLEVSRHGGFRFVPLRRRL
ncbi:protein-L-isoaspartate O-methyltransferase family protein [Corynebacterium nasicanis]|uniref:Protein-L-isoaspartate O-methyltransferase n=1 Tax=Corynebacterium nasicanis TaxID=1448267 RepID=A0ABW1QC14_9CORY